MFEDEKPLEEVFAGRHPATTHLLKFLNYDGLRESLQPIGRSFYLLAHGLVMALPDDPELTAGLRKLMEARNCMIRLGFETEALLKEMTL